MKRSELFVFRQGLISVSTLKGVRFGYAVSRNLKNVDDEISAMQESIKPSDEFMVYDDARLKLCEEMASKDDEGNPSKKIDKKSGLEQYIIEDKAAFDEAAEKLKDEHRDVLDAREQQLKEYQDFLDTEVNGEVKIYKISLDEIPEDISGEQMFTIEYMIEE